MCMNKWVKETAKRQTESSANGKLLVRKKVDCTRHTGNYGVCESEKESNSQSRERGMENRWEWVGVWYIPPAALNLLQSPSPQSTLLKVLAGPARFNLAEGTLKTLTVNKNKERVIFFKRLQLHLLIGFTHSNPLHSRPPPYQGKTLSLSLSSQLEQLFGLESSREQKANDQSGGFIGFMRYPWLAERIRYQKVKGQERGQGSRATASA